METLFQNYKIPEKIKHRSERGDLLNYFLENIKNKDGKSFNIKRIAFVLSHLKTPDLYYFQSVCKDVQNRRGQEALNKFFWWSLKCNNK